MPTRAAPAVETAGQLVSLLTRPSGAGVAAVHSWESLLALGRAHGVLPLLYRKLAGFTLPAPVREQLRRHYAANLARNLRLRAEQDRLLAAFARAGVRILPLKGLGWAEELYGDLAARVVDDLDFLVRPADGDGADWQLRRCGFAPAIALSSAARRRARSLLYTKGTATPLFVDLHFRLLPYSQHDPFVESFWRGPECRERHLLYLCLNFYTHRFARLRLALDLVAFLAQTRGALDWERVAALAQQFGFTRLCYHSLRLAAAVSGEEIPLRQLLALPALERLLVERWLGAQPAETFARAKQLAGPYGALVLLAGQDSLGRRAALARDILFPTSSAIRQDFWHKPDRSLLGCYLARWWRKGSLLARQLAGGVSGGEPDRT